MVDQLTELLEGTLQFEYLRGGVTRTSLSRGISSNNFLVVGRVSGSAFEIIFKSGEKYLVKDGAGYCTPENMSYETVSRNGEKGTFTWSHLSFTILGGIPLTQLVSLPISYSQEVGKEIAAMNESLFATHVGEQTMGRIATRKRLGMEMLQKLLSSSATGGAINSEKLKVLQRLQVSITYLSEHLAEAVQVPTLASMCHYSLSRFHDLFLRTVGSTPHQYQTKLRVRNAQSLLAQDQPIQDIAATCGYEDPHHFSRIFKQVTGMTASQYRKRLRNREMVT